MGDREWEPVDERRQRGWDDEPSSYMDARTGGDDA